MGMAGPFFEPGPYNFGKLDISLQWLNLGGSVSKLLGNGALFFTLWFWELMPSIERKVGIPRWILPHIEGSRSQTDAFFQGDGVGSGLFQPMSWVREGS